MSFSDAVRVLDGLRNRGVIRDFAVIGAVAAAAYVEPATTEDLDVVVLVDTDEEYLEVFRRLGEWAERMEGRLRHGRGSGTGPPDHGETPVPGCAGPRAGDQDRGRAGENCGAGAPRGHGAGGLRHRTALESINC